MATDRTHSAVDWKALSVGNLEPTPYAVRCDSETAAIGLKSVNGNTLTFNMARGEIIICQPVEVTALTGTVAGFYHT